MNGFALTPTQVIPIISPVEQAPPSPQPGGAQAPLTRTNWDGIEAQTANVLSAEQLDPFKSAEFLGPAGMGSTYQSRLNELISIADAADAKTAAAASIPH